MLVLSGCYKINVSIDVNEDGSGQADYLIAIDAEAFQSFDPSQSRDQLCADIVNDLMTDGSLPPDASIESYDDGTFCGAEIEFSFAASDNPGATLNNPAIAGAEDATTFGDTVLRKTDIGWEFRAPLETDAAGADAGFEGFEGLFSDIELTYSITIPGGIETHNADETSFDNGKTTFLWDIDLANQSEDLFATTNLSTGGSGGGLPLVPILIGLGLLAVAAGAAVLFFKFRSPTPELAGAQQLGQPQPFGQGQPQQFAQSQQFGQADPFGQPQQGGQAAQAGGAVQQSFTDPVWDQARGVWTSQDQTGATYWLDQATNQWHRL